MLARRFTIVCLLISVFGMGLSMLVAEKSRPDLSQSGIFVSCGPAGLAACPLPARR